MPRARDWVALLALLASAGAAGAADPIRPEAYATLQGQLAGRLSFESPDAGPEPGLLLPQGYRSRGAAAGERLAGQELLVVRDDADRRFDALRGAPSTPLSIAPGEPGQSMALARHRGLGSVAAFPLGPKGFPDIAARGEGAFAVLFDVDQRATGLRLHADYADPLGAHPAPGRGEIAFYARDGRLLARHQIDFTHGVMELGFVSEREDIAAFTLTQTDPGGIAIDDVLYDLQAPTS